MAITTLPYERDGATAGVEPPGSVGRRSGPGAHRVADAMSTGLVTCDGCTSLRVVAGILAEACVHCVVVHRMDDDGLPGWGIVSGLDLVADGAPGRTDRTAADAATQPITVGTGEALEHAAQLLSEHELTHLIVVESASGRPVGVISTRDVAAAMRDPSAGGCRGERGDGAASIGPAER